MTKRDRVRKKRKEGEEEKRKKKKESSQTKILQSINMLHSEILRILTEGTMSELLVLKQDHDSDHNG
jgi:hypothetical protein